MSRPDWAALLSSAKRYAANRHNEWDGMDEVPEGEWVRFEDVIRILENGVKDECNEPE